MEYLTVRLVFFSPTHTSAKIARAIGRGMGIGPVTETDLTCDPSADPVVPGNRALTVLAVPVYAGRVAPVAAERLRRVKGNGGPAVLAVVYGNRDYEDALVELRDLALACGFVPLAAGAFVGEHSYSRPGMPVAEGRPDIADLQAAERFGGQAAAKLRAAGALASIYPFFVKGNVPYREVKPSAPTAPVTVVADCILCGICTDLCPTGAIYTNDAGIIDTVAASCIKCCACVKGCPEGARVFDTPYTAMLHANFSARREPEIFL